MSEKLKNSKTTGQPFRTCQSARTRGDKGFALVVTLSLMILLTVIAVGLLSLSSISLRAFPQGQAVAVAQANAPVFDERVSSPKQAPLHGRLHDLVNRLPVRAHDFHHLGDIAASLQPNDDGFKLAGVQMPPGPLGPLVQGCRPLGLGMPPLGRPVHLRRDDNPLGLHVEFHVHDLPRKGDPKNLTVKICALHRESLAAPGHLLQGFPTNTIKSL